jgi:predicted RNase H-like nuclease (RuvC/YqgF family)
MFKPGNRTSKVRLEDAAMSAVLEEEVDQRMVRLESDVAHMRSDISDIKTDIRELRAEASASREGLGSLRVDVANLRDELHRGLAEVRAEMQSGSAEMRAQMHGGLAELRAEMHSADERLHRLIIRTSLSDRIWMLLLTGTMLTVMAHGFKWI